MRARPSHCNKLGVFTEQPPLRADALASADADGRGRDSGAAPDLRFHLCRNGLNFVGTVPHLVPGRVGMAGERCISGPGHEAQRSRWI